MNNTLKWFHVITKTIVHCLLGTIEYIGIPFLLACLSTFISPISSGNTLWLWIERIAFCFTIYEVIIVGVRKMQIDIRRCGAGDCNQLDGAAQAHLTEIERAFYLTSRP